MGTADPWLLRLAHAFAWQKEEDCRIPRASISARHRWHAPSLEEKRKPAKEKPTGFAWSEASLAIETWWRSAEGRWYELDVC